MNSSVYIQTLRSRVVVGPCYNNILMQYIYRTLSAWNHHGWQSILL